MKKWMKFTVLALVSLFVLNCSNALMGDGGLSGDSTTPPKGENNARVIIPLPGSPGRAVGLTEARNNTNFYAVYLKETEKGQYYSKQGNEGETISIEIPTGKYHILLFAGYQDDAYLSGKPLLLGSSFVQDRTISQGDNTVVLTIKTVDVDITVPASVPSNNQLSVVVTIDTKNPLITPADSIYMYCQPYGSAKWEDSSIGRDDDGYSKVDTGGSIPIFKYKYTRNWGPPLSLGTCEIGIETSVIPFDSDSLSESEWYLAKYDFEPDSVPALENLFKKTTAIVSPMSATLVIGWANAAENGDTVP
jgi:hypothetical protein